MTPIAPHVEAFLRKLCPITAEPANTHAIRMPIASSCCSSLLPPD